MQISVGLIARRNRETFGRTESRTLGPRHIGITGQLVARHVQPPCQHRYSPAQWVLNIRRIAFTPCALAQRAIKVFRNKPKKIIAMQKAAIGLIEKKYTWDKIMKSYLTLYQEARDLAGKQQEKKNDPDEHAGSMETERLPIPHPY